MDRSDEFFKDHLEAWQVLSLSNNTVQVFTHKRGPVIKSAFMYSF